MPKQTEKKWPLHRNSPRRIDEADGSSEDASTKIDSGSEGEDNQRTQAASTTDRGSEGEHYRIRRPGPNRGANRERKKGRDEGPFFFAN